MEYTSGCSQTSIIIWLLKSLLYQCIQWRSHSSIKYYDIVSYTYGRKTWKNQQNIQQWLSLRNSGHFQHGTTGTASFGTGGHWETLHHEVNLAHVISHLLRGWVPFMLVRETTQCAGISIFVTYMTC